MSLLSRLTLVLAMVLIQTMTPPSSLSAFASTEKTLIKDQTAKKKLLGKHMLSLQWISWKKFGNATVTEKDGVLSLKGQQTGKDGDFLKVEGKITAVEKDSFKFNGRIETKVSHINKGKACLREGDMSFVIKGKRKYWRLKEMDNPCDGVTDYVDLYF